MNQFTRIHFTFVALSCVALSMAPANACDYHSLECMTTTHYSTIELCNEALAKDKKNFHALIDRGVLYAQMEMEEQAVSDFEQATRLLDEKAIAQNKTRKICSKK